MTRARVIAWVMAVLVVFALRAAPARADAAAAEVLIQQGLKLRRENKPEEALQKFRQAHEMAPSSRTYGQMGLVEATLKRWTDSETHLAVALANPDDAWVHKNRAFLDQALALCREHLGDLVVTGNPGAEVTVAGTPAGTLPAVPALRLAEGSVEVAATAPGYEPFKQSVVIRPNSRTVVKIAMTASPVATRTREESAPTVPTAPDVAATPSESPVHHDSEPAASPDESHWRTWTALSLGVAGLGAAAWGITWIAIDGACPNGLFKGNLMNVNKDPICVDSHGMWVDHQTPYQTKTLGIAITAAGAGALVASAIVFFTAPSKSTSVTLAASPSAIWLVGRF